MTQWNDYNEKSWTLFACDARLVAWINDVYSASLATLSNPEYRHWWRHQNTWFAGVNALPNDSDGRCGSLALQGEAVDFIHQHIHLCHDKGGNLILDKAQVSVCTDGYPLPDKEESDAAHGFRLNRDATHLDGLLKQDGRRYLKEYHGFILGIGMTEVPEDAAPFVIYEGSHKLVQAWLQERLQNIPAENWGDLDLTDEYKSLRQQIFQNCKRVVLPLQKGESFLVHRFALHGTARWDAEAKGQRMLTFFRPPVQIKNLQNWLAN